MLSGCDGFKYVKTLSSRAKSRDLRTFDTNLVSLVRRSLRALRLVGMTGGMVEVDCVKKVSRQLSDMLDESDPIKDAYMLEVSSPGLDRPLKRHEDFERFCGRMIDIGLYKAINGSKTISGTLVAYNDGEVTVTLPDGNEFSINKDDASSVRLAVIF